MSEILKEPMLINTGNLDNPVPVTQAMMEGYAPDGELYSYGEHPQVTGQELENLRGADFKTIFQFVSTRLIGDGLPEDVLQSAAEEAYSEENFDFADDGNLRFTQLPSGIYIAGLSDGPTGSFKDMAIQPMSRWMQYLHQEKGIPLSILLSTSGDTGPAALHAFGELENTEIAAMLPKSGVSEFQWAQMVAFADLTGGHVLEFAGNFTDINDLHMEANKEYELGAANSVNIARIIGQIPYYFATYLRTMELEEGNIGDPIDLSIPAGNFGNALSAIIAKKMGLPIRNIIVATNENNALDNLISRTELKLPEYQQTDSSAQDVKMPSNAWRFLLMLYGNDPEKVTRTYQEHMEIVTNKKLGGVALGRIGIEDKELLNGLSSQTVTRDRRAAIIRQTYQETGGEIMIDPHTANGVAAILQLQPPKDGVPMIAMETAKPFKFDRRMEELTGVTSARPKRFAGLEERIRGKTLRQITDIAQLREYLDKETNFKRKEV